MFAIYSKGIKGISSAVIYTISNRTGTVDKKGSRIVSQAGVEPTLSRCRCNALTTELQR